MERKTRLRKGQEREKEDKEDKEESICLHGK